jgi:hypothetical protein
VRPLEGTVTIEGGHTAALYMDVTTALAVCEDGESALHTRRAYMINYAR